MKVAVIGAGKLGMALAETLTGCGYDVTLVDKNQDLLQKAEADLDIFTIAGNAKSPEFLREMNIDTYDFIVSTCDEDEKNLVISGMAKTLGCGKAIARVRDPEYVHQRDFLQKVFDVDFVVNPDRAMAHEIDRYLVQKYNLNGGYFNSGAISIVQFSADRMPEILNRKIYEIAGKLGEVLIVAISRSGKVIVPKGSQEILPGDGLYVLGKEESVRPYLAYNEKKPKSAVKKVMICGGGKTGFYLAELLTEAGMYSKVIEKDLRRCEILSKNLTNTIVLNGDATDLSLLEQEGLDNMDALVAVTGFDEENLLLSLLGNQRKIPDVVAKVSRRGYGNLIEQMGISMALNPTEITVSQILRYIQGRRRVIFSRVIQGQAEFIELVAENGMDVLGKPLSEIRFPENVLLAGIRRNEEVILPRGNTVIKAGDHVIVFCLLSQIPEMEQVFRLKKRGL